LIEDAKERISKVLASHRPSVWSEEHVVPAAVLIPLFMKEGQLHVLLTVRTDTVEAHKGQISFPGGAWEPGDCDMLATALRETEEEVGIDPARVEVLGQLDQLISVTDFIITPFVGVVPHPYEFTICEAEIVRLLEVPLSFFLDAGNRHSEVREHRGRPITVYFFDYDGDIIWGVTARILIGFLNLIKNADRKLLTDHPFVTRDRAADSGPA
jgi:8-oxo-dGTP pyrophosphatase MutT (NUDIX family)